MTKRDLLGSSAICTPTPPLQFKDVNVRRNGVLVPPDEYTFNPRTGEITFKRDIASATLDIEYIGVKK